jgi:hypothetical protein
MPAMRHNAENPAHLDGHPILNSRSVELFNIVVGWCLVNVRRLGDFFKDILSRRTSFRFTSTAGYNDFVPISAEVVIGDGMSMLQQQNS